MLVRFVDGEFRRGKCRIGERADGHGDDVYSAKFLCMNTVPPIGVS
jgi:hypothetical protein